MTLPSAILTRKPAVARGLLLIFAFTAWSLTKPAMIALLLLTLLFLTEVPAQRRQLGREPAMLLALGVLLITAALAVRAAWLFPAIASAQWQGAWAWTAPFLFVVPAWWLRRDPQLLWQVLAAAALGLAFGVLYKSDWALTPAMLHGLRYDFGFANLGLAFIASVALVGLVLLRARITGPRPWLGWPLWVLGLAALLFVLVVTQSRGAAVGLAIAGMLYAVILWRQQRRQSGPIPRQARLALIAALLLVTLAAALLWATRERQMIDLRELTVGSQHALSYDESASVGIRLNLAELGLQVFAARPLLGFGPGTSTTEFLVPQRVVAVADYQRANAPRASHLHSVLIEGLTRFGLAGVLIAALLLAVLVRA
ncbi:O-antigen ligase family protein, partial [uncultured Thiodictyon sp.]|uniref:O-antigen ligase family protein n=1 Tax=uncultured Thiodictyon sp. TaxID=1846217 RepID=UPI0025DF92CA